MLRKDEVIAFLVKQWDESHIFIFCNIAESCKMC